MSFLLEKKLEHEQKCEQALRGGKQGDAIFHAAKAAEFAYALAGETSEVVAKRYMQDAEGWLDIAERIKSKPTTKQGSSGGGKHQVADDDKPQGDNWLVTEKSSITFEKIAGMHQAKQSIREMVIHPLSQPEKARALGLKPGGGVLLYGPPGNGKTMLGKAIANELDAPFYYASGAQIRSKWHGESEQRLRSLIQAAKENSVAVLFFDEVEGLLPRRGGNSVVDNRIVTQFLAEIGGFEDSQNVLLMLGATNCPWAIDDAVFRTGRFDEKIFIGLPDEDARHGILNMHIEGIPCADDVVVADWVGKLDGYSGSDIVGVVNSAKRACLSRSVSQDIDITITNADMEAAHASIPTSAPAQLMKKYAAFQDSR